MTTTEKPDGLTDEHLDYLDILRDGGGVNMFCAAPYLANAFDLDTATARAYLSYWMHTFSKRH